jgi:hypothetical protein
MDCLECNRRAHLGGSVMLGSQPISKRHTNSSEVGNHYVLYFSSGYSLFSVTHSQVWFNNGEASSDDEFSDEDKDNSESKGNDEEEDVNEMKEVDDVITAKRRVTVILTPEEMKERQMKRRNTRLIVERVKDKALREER